MPCSGNSHRADLQIMTVSLLSDPSLSPGGLIFVKSHLPTLGDLPGSMGEGSSSWYARDLKCSTLSKLRQRRYVSAVSADT